MKRIRHRIQTVLLAASLLLATAGASVGFGGAAGDVRAADSAQTLADGVYSIDGTLRHASQDQDSMGNGAISKPMELVVSGGTATLNIELVPLTAKLGTVDFTGYLLYFYYFPEWEKDTQPDEDEDKVSATINSRYENTYDDYNDPSSKSVDSKASGKWYPHEISIPVELNDTEIWTQVYVPVMESIASGNGLQYARLQLDWSTVTRTGDLTSDTTGSSGSATDTSSQTVDKSTLHTLILSASSMASRESVYTAATIKKLKKAIEKAETVYYDDEATQSQVKARAKALSKAIIGLKEKSSSSSSGSSSSEDLDIHSLSDGTYVLTGKMYKTDKATLSMSNDAIGHKVKLTVKNGKYTLTLDFSGLKINSQYGYLGKLKYYTSGYKTNSAGSPTGTVKSATIKSYQKDSSGSKVKDSFGTNYPDKVTFPMISEAKEDGWVPLQVFVPIMESISSGSGTQNVWLYLDLSTLASADSDSFTDNDSSGSSSSSGSTSSGSSGSGSAVGSDTLLEGSSLPSDGTKSGLSNALESGDVSLTQSATAADDASADASDGADAEDEEEDGATAADVIPPLMSILAVIAGGGYKIWSRRLFR